MQIEFYSEASRKVTKICTGRCFLHSFGLELCVFYEEKDNSVLVR